MPSFGKSFVSVKNMALGIISSSYTCFNISKILVDVVIIVAVIASATAAAAPPGLEKKEFVLLLCPKYILTIFVKIKAIQTLFKLMHSNSTFTRLVKTTLLLVIEFSTCR